eukprot:GFYU01000032.1.p2 GENE.GFYU01000032.1~~GFYU01000032.1.p2  ORF type:complete len:110 (+),score=41.69 GFYU01000032.1:48-377(+)
MPLIEIKDNEHWEQFWTENPEAKVIIDFTASWCGPCKKIGPRFVALSEENPTAFFLKVDVDECEEVAAAAGISAMPTFKVFKAKKEVENGNFTGASDDGLTALVKAHMV